MKKKRRRNKKQYSISKPTPTRAIPAKSEDDITPILIPIADVCKLLSLSRSTLDRHADEIPGRRRICGKIMYYRPELEAWVKDARR